MEKYELTLVLDGKASAAKKKAVLADVEKTVSLLKGKVGTVLDWGVKDLAYQIKKSTTGLYLHLPLEMETEGVKKLVEKIKNEGDIIRYLMVRV